MGVGRLCFLIKLSAFLYKEISMEEQVLYERIGGEKTLKLLVDAFYDNVFANPYLAPLFKTDKVLIKEKQFLFLTQFLGGPDLYSQQYGHPRLRARHMPHQITESHATEWLKCMVEAINTLELSDALKDELFERFPRTAYFMVNTSEE